MKAKNHNIKELKTKKMKRKFITVILIVAAVLLTISSCKKDEDESIKDDTTTFEAEFYFRATIDGVDINFEEGVGDYGSGVMSSGSSITGGLQEIQFGFLSSFMADNNSAGFGIAKSFPKDFLTIDDIKSMFSVKSYPYGDSGDNAKDGAIIYYVDDDEEYWQSDFGTADQTGSNFEITEHIDDPASMGISLKITTAKFNCTLYNYSTGETKTLTNGVCRSRTVFN